VNVGDLFHEWLRLRDDIERVRLDFIRADLQVCLTLTNVAETKYDLGNWEQAARPIASAEKGYSTLLRLFSQAKHLTPEAKKELQLAFKRLRERLDGLQQRR
jgi:hypothetical protein